MASEYRGDDKNAETKMKDFTEISQFPDRGQNFRHSNNHGHQGGSIGRFQQSNQQQNSDLWNINESPFYMLNQRNQQINSRLNEYQQIPKTVFSINCGECRPKDEGVRVKISGKVVKRPRTGRFLEIKDVKGSTQLVATDDKPDISAKFQSIPADSYITVIGTVQLRPMNFMNHVRL